MAPQTRRLSRTALIFGAFVLFLTVLPTLQTLALGFFLGFEDELFIVRLWSTALLWLAPVTVLLVMTPILAPLNRRLLRQARMISAPITVAALALLIWLRTSDQMPMSILAVGFFMAVVTWINTFVIERMTRRRAANTQEETVLSEVPTSGAPEASKKQVTLKVGGVLQFFLGAIASQPIFALAVGVPILVALSMFGGDSSGVLLTVLVSTAVGAAICATLGSLAGRRTSAGWLLIVGAEIQPLWILYDGFFGPNSRTLGLTVLPVAWAVAGIALALSFWLGRRKRLGSALIGPAGQLDTSA